MKKNIIKKALIEKNMKGTELAEILGVEKQTIYNWNSGRGLAQIEVFFKMCKILEIDPNEFFVE